MADSSLKQPIAAAGPKSQGAAFQWGKWLLVAFVFGFLGLILLVPTLNVFVQALKAGLPGLTETFSNKFFLNAVKLTVITAVITVPLNTVFGLCAALSLANKNFPGRSLLISIIDLPFSISPVVAGLMLVLLFGNRGWFGPLLDANGIKIIFALPGIVMASIFITMPFIAREVLPALEEAGTQQEEAAATLGATQWQTFWRVTLPSIKWSLLYGLILTNARAMGEFGAVTVVSGNIVGKTQTLPLFIEEAHIQYNSQAAYTAALLLACLAVVTLVLKYVLERSAGIQHRGH
ncbi:MULTISPECIES: sulfate ABC transporter permease subunit CysW [Cyanophyceae]|uniref:sulfate ABC transporter permease subunit CysW n=1 Tax=Cyanophyceae TaxID=3028117 RepID=UPI0016846A87|nr:MULTISPECIES: sulfate ABC transporter permease subunit CysW [Cyanophyceae]MBD1917409.1 sulfate ABC transporter permease subunit CysW [Phormidium sp. FACHB-77]MBD2032346.1 sulfate ABC transporter permease subunit CysW [Phormidium sp. FACHB-322]MBD2052284.1 sulfate ABC transporter permease subunit CysW [Leptolyngbya sp. FACHB-60]